MAAPKNFHTVTPFIMAENANKFLEFMQQALGAKKDSDLQHPSGTLWHAQMTIGDSKIMVADTMGQHPPTSTCLYLYVDNPQAAFDKAVANGATSIMKVEDQFYGDKAGGVQDPFGNFWWFAQRTEELSQEELEKRAAQELKKRKAA